MSNLSPISSSPNSSPITRFLINPTAGGGHARRVASLVEERAAAIGATVEASDSGSDLTARARRLVEEGCERLVVVGGDGSVHLAIQALVGSECELAVVPTGRGDDFAMSLGVPKEPPAALEFALAGRARPVDLLRTEGPGLAGDLPVWGGLYTSFGFDSAVTDTANAQSRWIPRSATYIVAALRALVGFEAPVIRLEHDDGVYEGRSMFVTVCNAPLYGGGMQVAPGASMTDGLLDVLIVREVSKLTLLGIFPSVFSGRHVDHPAVELVRTRRAQISVSTEVLIGSDGEIEGRAGVEPTEVVVEPAALRVVTPDPA